MANRNVRVVLKAATKPEHLLTSCFVQLDKDPEGLDDDGLGITVAERYRHVHSAQLRTTVIDIS